MNYRLLNFIVRGDARGSLVAIENNKDIPFEIKRVFYIYNTQNDSPRGCHANKKSQFVLIPLQGSCKVKIRLPHEEKIYTLNTPEQGLWLNNMVWKEMYDFSPQTTLLILSDHLYDASEYISDYNEYLNICTFKKDKNEEN